MKIGASLSLSPHMTFTDPVYILIYDVFLTQPAYITYRVEENYNIADLKGSLINIFAIYILFLVFTASLCVRSSDVIVVVGIIFISILICYFGQDW
jgi:hypothetical protein